MAFPWIEDTEFILCSCSKCSFHVGLHMFIYIFGKQAQIIDCTEIIVIELLSQKNLNYF